jgi:tetratricopeptide (TPR) repeat protein
MKALGSITKDFPFLEEDVRRELEALMDAASDYWSFGELVARRAAQHYCPPMIVFLALYHVSRLENPMAAEKVYDAHPELPLPMPFIYPGSDLSRGGPELVEGAIEHFDSPLATFYMLMRLYRASDVGGPEEANAQERIENILEEHPALRLQSADYIGHTGYRVRLEGLPEAALEYYYRALEMARESDDKCHQVSLLMLAAEVEGQFKTDHGHFERAKRLLGEGKEIAEAIGDRAGLAELLNAMSEYSVFRGEYSEFMRCQMEAAKIREELGLISYVTAMNLAYSYRLAGDLQTSLEWYREAVRLEDNPYTHAGMATVYMSMGDLESAEKWLDSAKELVMQGGLEYALGRWYCVSAALESKKGDLESAMESYKKGLEIHERGSRMLRARATLHTMAKLEVKMFNPTKENRLDEHAGPFMKRYEEDVADKDLPGHEAQLLLLKAELRMKQGRHEESQQLMESVLEMTDYPALEYHHSQASATKESWIKEGLIPARSRLRSRNR